MSLSRRILRNSVAGAAAIVVVAMLAACAPGPGVEPDASPDEGAQGPMPLVNVACADLVPLADIRAALGDAVEPDDFPFEPGGTWPLTHVGLRQGGALFCHWSDAANQAGEYAANLEIIALPDAAAWTAWEKELAGWGPPSGFGDASYGTCTSSLGGSYQYCKHDVLVGGVWLYVSVQNLIRPDAAEPIVRSVVDAVAAAEVSVASWAAPASGITLPRDCEKLLSTATVAAAVATADIAPREASLNMPLIRNPALATGLSAGLDCSWSNPYSSAVAMPVAVSVLPGAGWAWDAAWARPRPDRSPATAVDRLGDAAFSGCATDENVCFVDVLADGAWITVSGNNEAGVDALIELARAALDALTAP